MVSFVARLVRRLWREDRGNVALILALSAVPTFGVLGFAIDYGTALSDKSKLDTAADEAALVAIKTVQAVMQGGGSFASGQAQGTAQAQAAFAATTGNLGFANVPAPQVTINPPPAIPQPQVITASVQYSTSAATNISKIVGIPSIPIAGTAATSLTLTTYQRIYILVDVSQSMGIATDAANMQALYNRVVQYGNGSGGEAGCVFGCHVKAPGQSYTNEQLAHSVSPAITLRIDSAIAAIQDIITQAQSAASTTGNIQIGLYTIGLNPTSSTSYINTVASPSSDFTALSTAAATITLGANNAGGTGDSTFPTSLSDFATGVLGPQGTGVSAATPLNYVYLISDGLQDVAGSCPAGHCTQALDPLLCGPIKLNATLGVIYTTYNQIYANNNSANGLEVNYKNLVYPYQYPGGQAADQIAKNMQSCASSSSYYFQASNGAAISSAMKQLFAETTQVAHLTQ